MTQRFLRQVLATVLGCFVAFILLVSLVIGLVFFSTQQSPSKLSKKTVLHIALQGKVVEHISRSKLEILREGDKNLIDLVVLKKAIRSAQEDACISGIYLELGQLQGGWAILAEISTTLRVFKAAGKFIIAYGEHYNPKTFYLASLADELVWNPAGSFFFKGLSLSVLFYKGLFDKLEISPQIFRVGQYKSATEPFTRYAMSEASQHQSQVILHTIYDQLIDQIASNRNLSPASLRKMATTLSVTLPQEAQKAQLITQIGHVDDVESLIRAKLGLTAETDIDYIAFNKYNPPSKTLPSSKAQIAVLVATGPITENSEFSHGIIPKTLMASLKKIKKDPNVKAIVLRINSPGGSVLASEKLWKELMITRTHKPIIASMADIAASGGYYLAAACNHIMAHPTTLTGSIGIFGLYFNIHDLLKNKLGITVDGVKTTPSADLLDMSRTLTAQEQAIIQKSINQGYANFLERVATSRAMSPAAIAPLAGGRVWPGTLAKQHGLVDELGSLEDAIKRAATLANVQETYTVSYWPKSTTWPEAISRWESMLRKNIVEHVLGTRHADISIIQKFDNMRGIQALLPYEITID